jgi:hypothetical protein
MLEEVVKIKNLSSKVEKLEIKLTKHHGSEKAARALRKKKYNTLEDIDEYRERYMTNL